MTDYFAVLGQPRRPWLDPEELKQAHQQHAFRGHPDRQRTETSAGSDLAPRGNEHAPTLAEVNEAYRVLSNPRLRLQHLLSLFGDDATSQTSAVSAELTDIFMHTAALLSDIDRLLQKKEQTTSALSLSLLKPEIGDLQQRVDAQLQQLQERHELAVGDLRRIDHSWVNEQGIASGLRTLAQRFGFLDRWIAQLREKQFLLSN
jgi:curved DNA-binding protein CbpA